MTDKVTPAITVRIGDMAREDGHPDYINLILEQLREQERNGDIRIVSMDDEKARVEFINPVWARLFGGSK